MDYNKSTLSFKSNIILEDYNKSTLSFEANIILVDYNKSTVTFKSYIILVDYFILNWNLWQQIQFLYII